MSVNTSVGTRAWRMVADLFAAAPWQVTLTVTYLLLAGLSEGIGFVTLLPVLSVATGQGADARSGLEQAVIDSLAWLGLPADLPVLLAIVVLGVVGKSALGLLAARNIGYASADMATGLRVRLIRGLMGSSWSYFVSQATGRLSNAISTEAGQAATAYSAVTNLAATVIQVAVVSGIALLASWQVTVVGLLAGIFMIVLLQRLVGIARQAGGRQTVLMNDLVSRLSDVISLIKPLKAMGREGYTGPLLEATANGINRAQRRLQISSAALSAFQEPLFTIFLAIGVYIALTYTNNTLVDLLFMAVLFQRIVVRTGSLQIQYQKMASMEDAYFSMLAAIETAEGHAEGTGGTGGLPTLEAGIVLKDIHFNYGDRPILDGVTLTIQAHRMTALVGPSGAGKTTLADMIIGLIRPSSGSILVDGIDLQQVDRRLWRESIGYVPQELVLLHDTILTNIALGAEGIGRQEAEVALRAAGAWDFVSAMPEGLDTIVGERGARLSGGQRQRISLARALARNPKLLILDEPTTALDPVTEEAIRTTLRGLLHSTTILLISHQTSLVASADQVFRLEQGQLLSCTGTS